MRDDHRRLSPAGPGDDRRVFGVHIVGRRVALERLGVRHLRPLYELCVTDGVAEGWPTFGRTLEEQEFAHHLVGLSPRQYAITRRDRGDTVGLVQSVDESLTSGTTDLGLVLRRDLWRAGWPFEAVVLFVDLLFRGIGLRTVNLSVPESVLHRLGDTVTDWMSVQAVLHDHVRIGDHYEDLTILALRRDDWDPHVVELVTGHKRMEVA